MKFRFIPEVHCKGMVTVENLDTIKEMTSTLDGLRNTDLGIQISDDGRVWICVNGVALLRFKPNNDNRWTPIPIVSDLKPEEPNLV